MYDKILYIKIIKLILSKNKVKGENIKIISFKYKNKI